MRYVSSSLNICLPIPYALFNKATLWIALCVELSACSTIGYPENKPLQHGAVFASISEANAQGSNPAHSEEITLILTFSGGGTRAAALAYGVMEELRDTYVSLNGAKVRLLDEVDVISSVSGGSITAAYYGVFREQIFSDFSERMLKRDLGQEIINRLLHPIQWFSSRGRSDVAAEVFEQNGFGNATFADMASKGPPLIVINATDLSRGVRFSFTQSHFNLLCSDLDSYPISRAVMASAAVPLLFDPVVLQNHEGCSLEEPISFLDRVLSDTKGNTSRNIHMAAAFRTYAEKRERPYVHLVDGGISDNLGLRAMIDTVEMLGGVKEFLGNKYQRGYIKPSRHIVVISVNASTHDSAAIDRVSIPPRMAQTINAVSDAQIHLYNSETIDHTRTLVKQWAKELSTDEQQVQGYFIVVDLRNLEAESDKLQVNKIPTTLGLPVKDVNMMILVGRNLLRHDPQFKELMKSLTHCEISTGIAC